MRSEQIFHLIRDDNSSQAHEGEGGTTVRATHEIPPGRTVRLVLNDVMQPEIVGCDAAESQDAVLLEAVRHGCKSYLAAVVAPAVRVRVNGLPAPPICVLRVCDEIDVNSECLLRLALFVRPYLGAPEPEWVGSECPLCTTPIRGDSRVYACPNCVAVMHADGKEVPEAARLECHLLASACPCCQQPIVLEEGFADESD